jgi:hypothetical protein
MPRRRDPFPARAMLCLRDMRREDTRISVMEWLLAVGKAAIQRAVPPTVTATGPGSSAKPRS